MWSWSQNLIQFIHVGPLERWIVHMKSVLNNNPLKQKSSILIVLFFSFSSHLSISVLDGRLRSVTIRFARHDSCNWCNLRKIQRVREMPNLYLDLGLCCVHLTYIFLLSLLSRPTSMTALPLAWIVEVNWRVCEVTVREER